MTKISYLSKTLEGYKCILVNFDGHVKPHNFLEGTSILLRNPSGPHNRIFNMNVSAYMHNRRLQPQQHKSLVSSSNKRITIRRNSMCLCINIVSWLRRQKKDAFRGTIKKRVSFGTKKRVSFGTKKR